MRNMNGLPYLTRQEMQPIGRVAYEKLHNSLRDAGPSSPATLLGHFQSEGAMSARILDAANNFSEDRIPLLGALAHSANAFATSIDFNSAPGEPREASAALGELSTRLSSLAEDPNYRKVIAVSRSLRSVEAATAGEKIPTAEYRENIDELFSDPSAGNMRDAYHLAETQRVAIGDRASHELAHFAYRNSLYRPVASIHAPGRPSLAMTS